MERRIDMDRERQSFYMGIGICIATLSFHRNHVGCNVKETIKETLNGAGINKDELSTYHRHFDKEDIDLLKSYLL